MRVQLTHLALAKRERALTATAHLTAHHDVEESNQQNSGQKCNERINPSSRFVNDLDLDSLERFPCRNLFVRNFEHVALEMLVFHVATCACESRKSALVLLGYGYFIWGHLVSALDNHAVRSFLKRKLRDNLGGISHQC